MKKLLYAFVTMAALACASLAQASAIIFDYQDFGSSIILEKLAENVNVGRRGQIALNTVPNSRDVKVVVYRGISISEAKKRFPLDPTAQHQYHYVEYTQALQYLRSEIMRADSAISTARLQETKSRIETLLGGR